ncbi:MAG: F0F1 ATP synthase subunit A [Chloroflexi bacterium]|nr:F0F1 ATP synthase subunit A [Chloroflexota bacterium]
MNGIQAVFPQTLKILGLPIRNTVLQTWIVMVALLGLAAWARPRLRVWRPKRWQVAVEWLVDYIENMMRDMGGKPVPEITHYLVTLIAFVAIANLLGLLPALNAPTRDLNTTLALSAVSLGACYLVGIRRRGFVGWLRSFVEPVFILLPLNIISDVSRVASMALRLFGNVIAGELIGAVIFSLVPVLAPLLMNALGSITGVLQALVFTILTFVFMLESMGREEDEPPAEHKEPPTGLALSDDSTARTA